jgi:hypothetical protein
MWRAIIALFVALASTALLLSVFLSLSETGRSWLTAGIEHFVDGRIPGSMKIGGLEEVGLSRQVAEDVEFFAPNGSRVLLAERVEVDWNGSDLLRLRVGFDLARVDGGEAVIDVGPTGRTTIEEAFTAKSQRSGGDSKKLELRNIHFENMRVLVRLSGETRFIVDDVQGFLSVWRRDTPGVRVALSRVQGTFLKPTILDETIELERLDGEVWAQEDHLLSMEMKTRIGEGGIEAFLDYYDREEEPVVLRLDPETGSGSRLMTFVLNFRSELSDKLEVVVVED